MKNIKKRIIFSTLFLSFAIGEISPTQAGIFKCTNKKGDVFYNDKPCPKTDKEKKLHAVKDPKNTYIPLPFEAEKKEATESTVIDKENNSEKELTKKIAENNEVKQLKKDKKLKTDSLSKTKTTDLDAQTRSTMPSTALVKTTKSKEQEITTKFYPKGTGKNIVVPGVIE